MKKFTPQPYWLIHHDTLLEINTDPIRERVYFIRQSKIPSEHATRLKWMRKVKRPDLFPAQLRAAIRAFQKAPAVHWGDPYHVLAQFNLAVSEGWSTVIRRHKKECPGCPFDYEHSLLKFPPPRE